MSGRVGYNGRSNGRPEIYLLSAALTTSNLALLLASKGIGSYIRQHFLDKTFQGLYQVNAFDMALLIPYFIVLVLLASYGFHRYVLVYLYYKNRKNHSTEPPSHFADLPRVTVQLPIFNEQFVVERLLDSICRLKYPLDKLDIQLLDDSTDETASGGKGWSTTMQRRDFRSAICIAPTGKASRRGRWRRG